MDPKKPNNAFQYYLKNWKLLSDEEKKPFIELEKRDKLRFSAENRIIEEKQEVETKKLKMYLSISHNRVSCVGLDNGFSNYETRGPIKKLVKFTQKEIEKMKSKNIIKYRTPIYKEIILEGGGKYTFNKGKSKKYDCITYGNGWSIEENYNGYVGKYTTYNNYKGETWTEHY